MGNPVEFAVVVKVDDCFVFSEVRYIAAGIVIVQMIHLDSSTEFLSDPLFLACFRNKYTPASLIPMMFSSQYLVFDYRKNRNCLI